MLLTGLSAVWIGFRIGGLESTRYVDDIMTALSAVAATAVCARTGLRHRERMRRFWLLLAGACLLWAVAEVTWGVYELILREPVPVLSWADVGYLGAVPVAVMALMSHPAIPRVGRLKLRWLFDGLIIATALAFLSWTLVLGPLWRSTDLSTLGGVVALAYPFTDVVMVFFIVIVCRRMRGGDSVTLWFLLTALLMMAVADSTYSYLSTTNSYSSGGPVDVGWIAAYLTIALAAFASDPLRRAVPSTAQLSGPTLTSFLAPFVAALLALLVAGLELQLGHPLDAVATSMAATLIALVLVRQALMAAELAGAADVPEVNQLRAVIRVALGKSNLRTTSREIPR